MTTHIYLDVDGVINAVTPRSKPAWGWTEPRRTVEVDGFPIRFNDGLISVLNELATTPGVAMHWLTTWCSRAPELLAPAVGLDGAAWPVVGEQHWRSPTRGWWKLDAIRDHLATTRPDMAIWIDDDIAFERAAAQWLVGRPDVIPVSPRTELGITKQQADNILTVAAGATA